MNNAIIGQTVVKGLIECEVEECGNMTHPSIPTCGECLNDGYAIDSRYQRNSALTRRNFITGY